MNQNSECEHEWSTQEYPVVSSRVCGRCNENELEMKLDLGLKEIERLGRLERSLPASLRDAHQVVISLEKELAELRIQNQIERAERLRLDELRANLVREKHELASYRAEALLVRQQLDAIIVPTTVTKPDESKVHLETWERVRLVIEQRGEATSELARMKARPVEVEHSRLDVMWQQLVRERDEAQANYRFMVERAADQKLDGYRELGARAAAAENDRDEAYAELETLRALIEGEPWAGAVVRRERDKARSDLKEALDSVEKAHKSIREIEKREIGALQAHDKAVALLKEAYRELSSIEAVTVSPSGVDGLIELIQQIRDFLESS